jgi:hypothetical protein
LISWVFCFCSGYKWKSDSELLRKSVLPDYYYSTLHRISWERFLESLLLCFLEEFRT